METVKLAIHNLFHSYRTIKMLGQGHDARFLDDLADEIKKDWGEEMDGLLIAMEYLAKEIRKNEGR